MSKKNSGRNFKWDNKGVGQSPLPGLQPAASNDEIASRFISKLMDDGFIGKNKTYLENYINSDISIAMNHVKNTYKTYVLEGKWSEEKFIDVTNGIIAYGEMLVPRAYMKYGNKYDTGTRFTHEQKTFKDVQENEYSDDELLAYIAQQLGEK